MSYYQENKEKMKNYNQNYYKVHREEILNKCKEKYFNTKKKIAKCKMCGVDLPKETSGHCKYCEKCLYSKGHGYDAHLMAAVRWFRKNKKRLDKNKKNK